jgi:hypothetical protein
VAVGDLPRQVVKQRRTRRAIAFLGNHASAAQLPDPDSSFPFPLSCFPRAARPFSALAHLSRRTVLELQRAI